MIRQLYALGGDYFAMGKFRKAIDSHETALGRAQSSDTIQMQHQMYLALATDYHCHAENSAKVWVRVRVRVGVGVGVRVNDTLRIKASPQVPATEEEINLCFLAKCEKTFQAGYAKPSLGSKNNTKKKGVVRKRAQTSQGKRAERPKVTRSVLDLAPNELSMKQMQET